MYLGKSIVLKKLNIPGKPTGLGFGRVANLIVSGSGKEYVRMDAFALAAGVYIYPLVFYGKIISIMQMVVAN